MLDAIVITGGTGGIGRALSDSLSAHYGKTAKILVTSRGDSGDLKLDLGNSTSICKFILSVQKRDLNVIGLINNGFGTIMFERASPDCFLHAYYSNVVFLTEALLDMNPSMFVINLTSVQRWFAYHPFPEFILAGDYAKAKHRIAQYSKMLAARGVAAISLDPGGVATQLNRNRGSPPSKLAACLLKTIVEVDQWKLGKVLCVFPQPKFIYRWLVLVSAVFLSPVTILNSRLSTVIGGIITGSFVLPQFFLYRPCWLEE